jgi:protein phosphatase PTC7
MIPHPAKAAKGGEDAYFVAGNTLGIADGVGGWEAHGIDSGLYSRSLMKYASEASEKDPNPLNVLKSAHTMCSTIPGSSTACVITLSGNSLEAVNLGDSGFLVIRHGQLIYKTREQQHYFNCPFQIGSSRDTPDDADVIKFDLQPGDVLVVATDGVFDNLSSKTIVRMAWEGVERSTPLTDLAQSIAAEAQRVAQDPNIETPFAEGARKVGQTWQGGKLDDITVLVSRVSADVSQPAGPSSSADVCMADVELNADSRGTSQSLPPKLRERN